MKNRSKTAWVVIVLFTQQLAAIAAWGASADPKDLPFLRKLNKAYYCLADQGLKGFTCDTSLEVSEWYSKELIAEGPAQGFLYALTQPKFHVSCGGPGEAPEVVYNYDVSSGNSRMDQLLVEWRQYLPQALKVALQNWKDCMWNPLNTEKNFAECGYKVVRLKGGYQTTQYFDDGNSITMGFDKDLKMSYENETKANGDVYAAKFTFKPSPQGLLLAGFGIAKGEYGGDFKYRMAAVGKYLLPDSIEVTIYNPDGKTKLGGFIFNFNNYKVDP